MTKSTYSHNAPRTRKIPDELKPEVCQRLACYETTANVAKWLEEEHDIKLDPSSLHNYIKGDAWVDQFQRFRAQFNADLIEHAGASKSWRVLHLTGQALRLMAKPETPEIRKELREIFDALRREMDNVISTDGKPAGSDTLILPDSVAKALRISLEPEAYKDGP